MNAAGITCGIGSMLLGARQAGFDVKFNCEWRKYYFVQDEEGNNTFQNNFPEAAFILANTDEEYGEVMEDHRHRIDLAMGHPECGAYSQLSTANKGYRDKLNDVGDIPRFVKAIATLRPRFFAMDDLAKSLNAFPMSEYHKLLPDYDLFPEQVSNWGYGNIQKNRNRMFMLGALKSEFFTFVPGEEPNLLTVKDVVGDMYRTRKKFPNHDPHSLTDHCARMMHVEERGSLGTWRDFRDWMKSHKEGTILTYTKENGEQAKRLGTLAAYWNGHSHVLCKTSITTNPKTGLPFTIRERARIQGFPDDFIFYGTKLGKGKTWSFDKNHHMIAQTGKAMPVQFNRFFANQVKDHMESREGDYTGVRLAKPVPQVDEAKYWFCHNAGYMDQEAVCAQCWLKSKCSDYKGN